MVFSRPVAALAVGIVLVAVAACSPSSSGSDPRSTQSGSGSDPIKVGVTFLNLQDSYWNQILTGMRKDAPPNVTFDVADPNGDASQQVSQIENFTTSQVDAIVIAAIDPAAVNPALKQAQQAGIKIIAQSTKVETYDTYITVGEREMGLSAGEIAGSWIAENLDGNARVGILNYPKIPQVIDREKGIREGLAQTAPNTQVVAAQPAATAQEGQAAAETVLQANPNLSGFVCINDDGCQGAEQAAKAAGKEPGRFGLVGVNGSEAVLKAIEGGNTLFVGTVDIQPQVDGQLVTSSVVKLVGGDSVPKDQLVPLQKIATAAEAKAALATAGG